MGKVIIMRGVPGSGKSTWAETYAADFSWGEQSRPTVVSADDYFVNPRTGEYKFNPAELSKAHNQCLGRYLRLLTDGAAGVVVDNTNVNAWEVAPYYRLAELYGYEVEVVWLVCDPARAAARCVHGVPPDRVRQMAQSFEPLPPWWNVTVVPVA